MEELADPSTKVILVVDDDDDVRSFVETILQLEGFKVETARSGNEALAKVQKRPPDLIITDLMMPEGGGYDVLKGLQGSDGSKIPVIVNTARQIDPSTEEMIRTEANVIEFLHKPISIPLLYGILWRTLKTKPKNTPKT